MSNSKLHYINSKFVSVADIVNIYNVSQPTVSKKILEFNNDDRLLEEWLNNRQPSKIEVNVLGVSYKSISEASRKLNIKNLDSIRRKSKTQEEFDRRVSERIKKDKEKLEKTSVNTRIKDKYTICDRELTVNEICAEYNISLPTIKEYINSSHSDVELEEMLNEFVERQNSLSYYRSKGINNVGLYKREYKKFLEKYPDLSEDVFIEETKLFDELKENGCVPLSKVSENVEIGKRKLHRVIIVGNTVYKDGKYVMNVFNISREACTKLCSMTDYKARYEYAISFSKKQEDEHVAFREQFGLTAKELSLKIGGINDTTIYYLRHKKNPSDLNSLLKEIENYKSKLTDLFILGKTYPTLKALFESVGLSYAMDKDILKGMKGSDIRLDEAIYNNICKRISSCFLSNAVAGSLLRTGCSVSYAYKYNEMCYFVYTDENSNKTVLSNAELLKMFCSSRFSKMQKYVEEYKRFYLIKRDNEFQ